VNDGFVERLIVDRFDDALRRCVGGSPIILRARRNDTLERLIERAQMGPLMLEVVRVDQTPGRLPSDCLIEAAIGTGAEVRSIQELAASPRLRYTMFVAAIEDAQETHAWLNLAGALASSCSTRNGDGAGLIVGARLGRVPSRCQLFDDGAMIGPVEALFYARRRQAHATLVGEAADAAAVEVSRGDLSLLDRLLLQPVHERFDAVQWVRSQPPGEDAKPLPWRGRDEPCPFWLARNSMPRLLHRVWRGHVGVLFPWLEEVREQFLLTHGHRLRAGARDRESGELLCPSEYEWSDIAWALREEAPSLATAADALRLLRNELAHGRPVTWASATRAEDCVTRLMAWRRR
jgi:hypothetical protein